MKNKHGLLVMALVLMIALGGCMGGGETYNNSTAYVPPPVPKETVYTEIPLVELKAAVEKAESDEQGFIVEGKYNDLKEFVSFDNFDKQRMNPDELYKVWITVHGASSKELQMDKLEGTFLIFTSTGNPKSVFADEERASITEDLFSVEQNAQGKITITGFKGKQTHIVIPEKLFGIEVSEIGARVFSSKQLNTVILPKTLVRIGTDAFYDNNLTELILPNSVTAIAGGAFARNKLTALQLPSRLTTLEAATFMGNSLTEIVVPNNITTINVNFQGNHYIETSPFASNPLRKISLGTGLKKIDTRVVNNFDIPEITLGNNVNFVYIRLNLFFLREEETPVNGGPFINYYISQGRKAGTYIKNGQIWSRKQ
jgi:hypothetical protein